MQDKVQPKALEKISYLPEKTARNSKQSKIIKLLQNPGGATIEELVTATGWQAHSVRGAMSAALKKRLGFVIASDVKERGRVYRITGSVSRS